MRIKISDTLLVRGVLIFNFTLLQMHSNWKFFSDLSPEDQVKNGKFFGFFTKHSYPHELNSLHTVSY